MHVDIVGGGWWVCHNSVCVVSGYYVVVSHPALCYTRAHTGSTLGLVVASCPGFWVSQLLQCQLVSWCHSGTAQNEKLEPLVHFGRAKVVGWESWVKPQLV